MRKKLNDPNEKLSDKRVLVKLEGVCAAKKLMLATRGCQAWSMYGGARRCFCVGKGWDGGEVRLRTE
eukprot:15455307-Alexandrium_andersonii.AAC.1